MWEMKWCAPLPSRESTFPLASDPASLNPSNPSMNSLYFPIAAFGLGGAELLVILCIALLLFGGKKLPDLAKGLGKSIREFKKAAAEGDDETTDSADKKAVVKPEATKTHGSN